MDRKTCQQGNCTIRRREKKPAGTLFWNILEESKNPSRSSVYFALISTPITQALTLARSVPALLASKGGKPRRFAYIAGRFLWAASLPCRKSFRNSLQLCQAAAEKPGRER